MATPQPMSSSKARFGPALSRARVSATTASTSVVNINSLATTVVNWISVGQIATRSPATSPTARPNSLSTTMIVSPTITTPSPILATTTAA
jgi:hypothetical protein